jgi:peptide/nickel transport system permease protein
MRRLAQYAIVIWVAVTINFALPRLAPGDPLEFLIGVEIESLSAADQRRLLGEVGLDRPLMVQYGAYLSGIARGDLGRSIRYGRPVSEILRGRFARTALIVIPSLLIATLIGTALGVAAAWRRGGRTDALLLGTMLFVDALPAFWIGMVLLATGTATFAWLPPAGTVAFALDHAGGTATLARAAVLPVLTLALAGAGHAFLVSRAALLTAVDEDYVLLAQAKGLRERTIAFRYALPNAMLPILTSATLGLTAMVSGAVVVETIFAYPGLGRLAYEAVAARDYPLLQGAFLLLVIGVVAINAVTDASYAWIDPRAGHRR